MARFRPAKLDDIELIQQIEAEYYEGFSCPKGILEGWIRRLSENFIVAEEEGKIIAFIFFEYLNEIKAVPFVHGLAHEKNGRIAYVSEVGASEGHKDALQKLFIAMAEKARGDGCKKIIWLTGHQLRHDRIETELLEDNGFEKTRRVEEWESYPGHFVSDHWIWAKKL